MTISVLLIESRDDAASVLRGALVDSWLAWDVQCAGSLDQARSMAAGRAFDAALIAYQLSDGVAYDALAHLRGIPALVLVPAGAEAQAAHALRHGFADFAVQDATGQYLLSLPSQIEAALERTRAAQSRDIAEQLLARQHRLLQAIFRVQSLFIASAPAGQTFDTVLSELLALTDSALGFLGQVALDAGGRRRLHVHALSDGASRQPMAPVDAGGWVLDKPDTVIGQALLGNVPLIHNDAPLDPQALGLPPGLAIFHSFVALPIVVGGDLVAMAGLANRAQGYSPADMAFLQPLLNTVGQLEQARRADAQRRAVESELARTSAQLANKTAVLELTMASVSQGMSYVDENGVVRLCNDRYLELLDLPRELLERQPHMSEVVAYQRDRGDFGPAYTHIEPTARNYVASESIAQTKLGEMPEHYVRKTTKGRYLEVRTRLLAAGGRVRTFADVTDYLAAQNALRQSEARWRSMTQLSSDWYWEQDAEGRLVRLEGQTRTDLGVSAEQLGTEVLWEPSPACTDTAALEAVRRSIEARETFHDVEMRRRTPTGEPLWVALTGQPIFDDEGVYRGYRGVARDITQRKSAEAEIERLAFYDELTGLANRRLLLDRLAQAVAHCARRHAHGALLFLDLDNFKDINDTLGHEWGDRLLREVALRLTEGLRTTDTVARLGGDEFVVILQGLSGDTTQAAQEVEAVALKVLARLNQAYEVQGRLMHSTPSIGMALFDGQSTAPQELLKHADLAMYEAKAQGRNTACFFDPQMQAAATARSLLEADIRQALAREEFFVHYQRVVDARGEVLGAEALVRWQHPKRGVVLPGEFIGVVEQTGLILPLGRLVLRSACAQLAQWAGCTQCGRWTLSVNVSAQEFRHADFVAQVLAILDETGARPDLLKLELTESLLLHDVEECIAKMQMLRGRGVRFSLDDFGTGYSSLTYLKRLPLDQLKIDQSFVRDVLSDPNDAAIACAIVTLAQSLGLDVVAEGVETDGQRQFLLQNGCGRFQGYLFGRPGPVDDLLRG